MPLFRKSLKKSLTVTVKSLINVDDWYYAINYYCVGADVLITAIVFGVLGGLLCIIIPAVIVSFICGKRRKTQDGADL